MLTDYTLHFFGSVLWFDQRKTLYHIISVFQSIVVVRSEPYNWLLYIIIISIIIIVVIVVLVLFSPAVLMG
jgi:hypothetical protein